MNNKKIEKRKLKIIDVLNPLGDDVKESASTTVKLLTSALTLVSALAWNEAIKGVFEIMKEDALLKSLGVLSPFIYAIIVTVITVFAIRKIETINDKVLNKKPAKLEKIEKKDK